MFLFVIDTLIHANDSDAVTCYWSVDTIQAGNDADYSDAGVVAWRFHARQLYLTFGRR